MKLIGELNRSFGNFVTLRGIASMKDLAKISFADSGYQRDLLEQHGEAMQNFLEKGEYTFFPELVFSVSLPHDLKTSEKAQYLYNSIPSKSFKKTTFQGFTLKAVTTQLKSDGDLRAQHNFCRGEFEPIKGTPILQRIDGNHRLSASENMEKDIQVPYCIIFYIDQIKAEKFNRVLFNNINFKSLPLTSEENLHLIFEKTKGEYIFSDEELKDPVWFGNEYVQARTLYHSIILESLDNIKAILQEKGKDKWTRTMFLELSKIWGEEISEEKSKETLQEVNNCYKNYPLKSKGSYQLLMAHLYYSLKQKLQHFSKWVQDNHIYELNSVDPQGIINIFDKVLESKRRQIFLAMDFGAKATQNRKAIENAVKDINEELDADLRLELIRIDKVKKGYSFAITDGILKNIEEGGYLIVDISLANSNVYYELGYQMGLNKGKNNPQDNFLLVHNAGIAKADFDKDKSFNISHISIEKADGSDDLRERVKKQLKKYYRISNE